MILWFHTASIRTGYYYRWTVVFILIVEIHPIIIIYVVFFVPRILGQSQLLDRRPLLLNAWTFLFGHKFKKINK